jgi:phage gp36-like protein
MYITNQDYKKRIKDEVLAAIINGDITIREDAEMAAIEEAKAYLSSRYDIRVAFLDYDLHSTSLTYIAGDRIVSGTSVLEAKVNISIPGTFNANEWTTIFQRSALLTTFVIDIVLYRLCRINPRQQTELYTDRYNQAVEWFKSCAKGEVNAQIPAAATPQQDGLNSSVKFGNKSKFSTKDSRYF